ncbi:hypothetical protein E2562_001175 [Oryza meyeriana var. granulata]|uniref:Uncharacterized protein n=1 Tax=Oryza meyeriana var. granulata TaxID=110450 RepID=A0A6G1DBX5_9ORYZ|nr:hypothetical protein E2562_001175 [Oryza meyeriana var. granulata]
MLRVVVGSGNVFASELPREDLVLCDDPGRVALHGILPKCDAMGILEHASRRAPRPMRISGIDGGEARHDSGAS